MKRIIARHAKIKFYNVGAMHDNLLASKKLSQQDFICLCAQYKLQKVIWITATVRGTVDMFKR
jgi:hypothetical protein